MQYNNLGSSGLKISRLSYGSWLTFAKHIDDACARKLIHTAFDQGINFFDNAEAYAQGKSEQCMGRILQQLPRDEFILSTKLFWGGSKPNQTGLSRKHLRDGLHRSLGRLQVDYVDLLYCHRPDPATPLLETMQTMDMFIRQGLVLYWGTSEWSAVQLQQAYELAHQYGLIAPSVEQPQYNMLHRIRVEQEYAPLYTKYGIGTTTWSPLAGGLLTGKYLAGIPKSSRFELEPSFKPHNLDVKSQLCTQLQPIAAALDCSLAQLAIAWCLKNANVSSVILGATTPGQLDENIKSLDYVDMLDQTCMLQVDSILQDYIN